MIPGKPLTATRQSTYNNEWVTEELTEDLKDCKEEMFWMEEGRLLTAAVKRGIKLLASSLHLTSGLSIFNDLNSLGYGN